LTSSKSASYSLIVLIGIGCFALHTGSDLWCWSPGPAVWTVAISSILDDLFHPPVRGVQADVGIGGSVQEVDRSGVVRVPHDPAPMRAVQPIPTRFPRKLVPGMTCEVEAALTSRTAEPLRPDTFVSVRR